MTEQVSATRYQHGLDGKVVVVTGGSAGIGLATAQRFINAGATVYITGRRQPALDEACQQLGPRARSIRADVARLEDQKRLFTQIREEAGEVHVLIANGGGGGFCPLGEMSSDYIDQIIDTNLKGTVYTVQSALPLMPTGSAVVLMSSATAQRGIPGASLYAASKAGVRALARGWAQELKPRGIRVNVVSPGPVITPGLRSLVPDGQFDAMQQRMAEQSPSGRLGQTAEIAEAIYFLATAHGSYANGTELVMDGGLAQV